MATTKLTPRQEATIVRQYLDALHDQRRPLTGRRTVDYLKRRLKEVEEETAEATPYRQLLLAQERLNLEADLAEREASRDGNDTLDDTAFVKVAASFSERRGITRKAWRAAGVPAEVLKRAGI